MRLISSVILLGAACVGGCGDDTGSGAEGGGGSTADGGGGGGVGAGSAEYEGYGAVYGSSYPSGSSFVQASFVVAGASTCTTTEDGACQYIECPNDAVVLEYRSAGVVTITGGLREVTLTPDASDEYPFDSSARSELFTGGETLTVTAAGGDVPAFEVEGTAPSAVTLSSPALMPLMVVDRSADLAFAWTGGEAGDVVAVVGITRPDRVTNVICRFPASSGSGTIPASMLSNLEPTGDADVAAVAASVSSEEQVEAGAWLVSFSLATNALTQDGSVASVPATIE